MSNGPATGMIRVLVAGARGRMGRETVAAVTSADGMEVVAEVNRGDDLASAIVSSQPDVMVDFTVPTAVMDNARATLDAGVVPLIGATGLSVDNIAELRALCQDAKTPALIAPNFAIGAVLLMRFAAEAARYLPDVEIIELHHERKLDAPSGTATRTAELIAQARQEAQVAPRSASAGAFETFVGARGGKAAGDIPVHSVRLPGFVASQEVLFGGPGQRLTLRHDSIDRASFMPGVLLAIRRARTLNGLVIGLENLL